MSILHNGKYIVGPGNSARIGTNGNWWVGEKDTGVSAYSDNVTIDNSIYDLEETTKPGLHIVTDPDNVSIWYVDSKGNKTSVNGTTPHIGSNGNWFIGSIDTEIHATAKTITMDVVLPASGWTINSDDTYMSEVDIDPIFNEIVPGSITINPNIEKVVEDTNFKDYMDAFNKVDGIYANTSLNKLRAYTVDNDVPTLDLPYTIIVNTTSSTTPNLSINDNLVTPSATWSSTKISRIVEELKAGAITGKALEFRWEGTKLGVRQSGYTAYKYADLVGPKGESGASVVGGEIDEAGNLILEIPESNSGAYEKAISIGKYTGNLDTRLEPQVLFEDTGRGKVKLYLGKSNARVNVTVDSKKFGTTLDNTSDVLIGFNILRSKLEQNNALMAPEIVYNESIKIEVINDKSEPITYAMSIVNIEDTKTDELP